MEFHPRDLKPICIEHFFTIMLALAVTLLVLLFIIALKYDMRNRSFVRSRLQAEKQFWLVVSYGTLLHTSHADIEMAVAEQTA
jgi:hypothetical protein